MSDYQAFRYRFYPDEAMQQSLAVQFGHARFVYNWALQQRQDAYKQDKKSISYEEMASLLTKLKKNTEHQWLKQGHSQVLQQKLMDLQRAYLNFFEGRAAFPRFKRKDDQQTIRFPQGFKLTGGQLCLPKLGWIKLVYHRPIEGIAKNVTVSKTKSGHYYVSIQCLNPTHHTESQDQPEKRPIVGADLGLTHFLTLSTGEQVENPRPLRRASKRQARLQQKHSRKKKGSKNRERSRKRVAKQSERVANQRKDFHHKLSKRLVTEYSILVFENLNIRGMVKNRRLSKSIHDAGWGQFVGFCEYKGAWYGCEVRKVGRFFASSKVCSECGWKHETLALKERSWTCGGCGVLHDRDKNAAKNILVEGMRNIGLEPTDSMSVETV